MKRIKISVSGLEREARLNDSPMAQSFWKTLPVRGQANKWGDEIYFRIPAPIAEGEKKSVVEKGDIAFWPSGSAFCFFFGPTPMSKGDEIRPASEVILLGKVEGELDSFKSVKDGEEVLIEKSE